MVRERTSALNRGFVRPACQRGAVMAESVERRLYDLCVGVDCPTQHLLDHGAFPPGWVHRFDELLAEANARWGSEHLVPKPLVAALFFASFFPEYRYDTARIVSGRRNEHTERDIAHLRSASSKFMFRGG